MIGETDGHWELELTPKQGSNPGYGKLRITVDKEHFAVERIEYFDREGQEKIKVEERSGFKLYEGKHYAASTVRMTSLKDGHQTVIKNHEFKFDQGIPVDYFTTRNLKKPVR